MHIVTVLWEVASLCSSSSQVNVIFFPEVSQGNPDLVSRHERSPGGGQMHPWTPQANQKHQMLSLHFQEHASSQRKGEWQGRKRGPHSLGPTSPHVPSLQLCSCDLHPASPIGLTDILTPKSFPWFFMSFPGQRKIALKPRRLAKGSMGGLKVCFVSLAVCLQPPRALRLTVRARGLLWYVWGGLHHQHGKGAGALCSHTALPHGCHRLAMWCPHKVQI